MKKIIILILFVSITKSIIFSYDGNCYNLVDRDVNDPFNIETIGTITFNKNDFIIEINNEKTVYNYKLIVISGLSYIKFDTGYNKKWLIIFSDEYIFIYDEKNKLIYEGYFPTPSNSFQFVKGKYTATSYLIEGKIYYSPENLRIYRELNKPWANAGGKYANNESINIKFDKDINKLIISNGYIDYNKPDLFLKNSRIKSITVFDSDTDKKILDFMLKDTSELQSIELNQDISNIKIKINDVYKGTEFKDTCINFILGEYYMEGGLGPQGSDVN